MLKSARRTSLFAFFVTLFMLAGSPAAMAQSSLVRPLAPTGLTVLTAPTIGQHMGLLATSRGLHQGNVHFYVASSRFGVTPTIVDGVPVLLPLAGAQHVGTAGITNGRALLRYGVPRDPALIGQTLYFVTVTVQQGQARISASMPSGPILGDAIA